MLEAKRFGDAGAKLVIEQKLVGREVSVLALTDGKRLEVRPRRGSQDDLRRRSRANTGGMGTVSPAWASDAAIERVRREILEPPCAGSLATASIIAVCSTPA